MMPTKSIGIGIFLLDVYCLGVKDAFYAYLSQKEFNQKKQQFDLESELDVVHPSCARKLITLEKKCGPGGYDYMVSSNVL